jgi:hypothetical protein
VTLSLFRPLCVALLLVSAGAGCRKNVTIQSEPSGARVRVNGLDKGVTPVTLSLESNIFTNYTVELEKEGYERARAGLPTEGRLGIAICGYIVCPPLIILARQPVSEAIFVMRPAGDGPSLLAPPPPPSSTPPPPPPPPPPAAWTPEEDAVSSATVAAPAPTPMVRPDGKGPLFIKTGRAGLQEVAAGRKVTVTLANGEVVKGTITAVAEHGIVLQTADGERILAAWELVQIVRDRAK